MKKIKIFMAAAFVLAIGGAFASKVNTNQQPEIFRKVNTSCVKITQTCVGNQVTCTFSNGAALYKEGTCTQVAKKNL